MRPCTATVNFFETVIFEGWPCTWVIAIFWVIFGWPFYLFRELEK